MEDYSVHWSLEAEDSFYKVVDDLRFRWPPKVVDDFIDLTDDVIIRIAKFPYLYRAYKDGKFVRHGIVHKNITMFYRVNEDQKQIEILLFWATKTNPEKLRI